METSLLNGLYWNNMKIRWSTIYYESRLLGSPRIRMLKVNYHYETEEKSKTAAYWGRFAIYGGGGFVKYLTMDDRDASLRIITELKQNRWIGRGTRAIFIDFILYNANLNLFCIVQLIMELPATGGVFPSSALYSQRLIRYVTNYDYFVFVCEIIFCAFVIYYVIEEILELIRCRLAYFRTFWNCLDLVYLISFTVIYFDIVLFILTKKRLTNIMNQYNEENYINLDELVTAQNNFSYSVGIFLIFAWIKIMKYISFNKTMTQLSATLARSAKDIGGFSIMFFIFFFAYAQFGYLVLGTQMADYSTLFHSAFALFRTILGDFDYDALRKADRFLGPIFFFTYVFFVFFVLLNMFLAIINDSYVEVKSELVKAKNEVEMIDVRSTRKSLKFSSCKIYLGFRQGFTNEEISEAFIKYDIIDRKLELDEMQLVVEELEKKHGITQEQPKETGNFRDINMLV
ncbi:unnamed protein product [Dracunculus medinensis]|uniref:Uncharacterized protein n=1 Tax=Dracunculus medinensis TaxID=318479 RepID=A0A3P7PS10_DRAME|nr:unnamed protein product [Dracunculus medinensis]